MHRLVQLFESMVNFRSTAATVNTSL